MNLSIFRAPVPLNYEKWAMNYELEYIQNIYPLNYEHEYIQNTCPLNYEQWTMNYEPGYIQNIYPLNSAQFTMNLVIFRAPVPWTMNN